MRPLILALVLTLGGCSYLKSFGSCMEGKIPGAVSLVQNDVTTILQSGLSQAGVYSALEGLGIHAGLDVVDCAVSAAIAQMQSKAEHAPSYSMDAIRRGVSNGEGWLKRRGKK